jgi:N-acetylglucosamine-6-phosphate deacetylase
VSSWIVPTFFDVQINGCLGIGFNSPTLTLDGIRRIATECRRHGIGGFCPTLITDSFAAIERGFHQLAAARAEDAELARMIPGYHLEGPYLSAEDGPRGAHPRQHCRNPDWDEFCRWQDAAEGRILMVTIAPERVGACQFIERATMAGVVVAIGHTTASGAQILDAIAAGARTSTHLGNGAHATLPRHPNILWDQLAADELWASFIPDGHHLPDSFIQVLLRAKPRDQLLITCDASPLAGLPAGRYHDWGAEFDVLPSGQIVVPGTPYLAGSGSFTDDCVNVLLRSQAVTLADAIRLASVNPRRLLRLPIPNVNDPGSADLMTIDVDPQLGIVRIS